MASIERLGHGRWRAHRNLVHRCLQGVGMAMQSSTYVDPPSTLATYESILDKHVLPRWGSTPLARVAREDVAAWVSDLIAFDLSAATVR